MGKRVVVFQIPSAMRGIPTTWHGQAYGRHGDSTSFLTLKEIDQIRSQAPFEDWSRKINNEASLKDLSAKAILFAREQYAIKFPRLRQEIDAWNDLEFLNKSRGCVNGNVTNAALLLLGAPESENLLSPSVAQITWVLKGDDRLERDYEHFSPPFILAVDKVLSKIRNLTIRHMPSGTLFPIEVKQYDPWVLRECLNNCIAHQDYTLSSRINVLEEHESILFTNKGEFIPSNVENVIYSDAPPDFYRNKFLAQAMVNLNMIDTIGSGIKRMFNQQRNRFFPLPDYNLEEEKRVKVRLYGKIIDENYTRMLIEKADLSLFDAIALDKVQKNMVLSNDEFKKLKAKKLVEGRRPNLYISATVAEALDDKATYIKKRGLEKEFLKKILISYLKKFKNAHRKDIDELLLGKVPDVLSEKQKKTFVKNLLQEMRRAEILELEGKNRWATWALSKKKKK